jgi:16S rRNA (guanine1207-N2)-methyltransferase
MSIPKTHYFEARPEVASKPRTVRLRIGEIQLDLLTDRGVFGSKGIDLGTLTLLKEGPAPPGTGDILDLGAGYGPIALTLARKAPEATVWAVDVNQRANELARQNAESNQAPNVRVAEPDQVPPELSFDAIYSNPPVRVGKQPLHDLLLRWLPRLKPDARAYLVVQRNLGSDSLAKWLDAQGYEVARLKSKKGYRILQVAARRQPRQ